MIPLRSVLIRTLPKNHMNPHYADEIMTLNKLTIGRFERTLQKVGWHIREREAFLIRPSIAKRLGLPVVKGNLVAKLPLVRDLFITGIEYLLETINRTGFMFMKRKAGKHGSRRKNLRRRDVLPRHTAIPAEIILRGKSR